MTKDLDFANLRKLGAKPDLARVEAARRPHWSVDSDPVYTGRKPKKIATEPFLLKLFNGDG